MLDIDKHRVESLADGIYAVALTLLVLDLKLPDIPGTAPDAVLARHLAELLPRLLAWLASFVLLSVFWLALHRLLSRVVRLDGRMLFLCFAHILLVALSPFVIATYGANVLRLLAQVAYNGMLCAFAGVFLLMVGHMRRSPELMKQPLAAPEAIGLRTRFGALFVCAILVTAIGSIDIRWFGVGYAPMFLAGVLARRLQRRATANEKPPPLSA